MCSIELVEAIKNVKQEDFERKNQKYRNIPQREYTQEELEALEGLVLKSQNGGKVNV